MTGWSKSHLAGALIHSRCLEACLPQGSVMVSFRPVWAKIPPIMLKSHFLRCSSLCLAQKSSCLAKNHGCFSRWKSHLSPERFPHVPIGFTGFPPVKNPMVPQAWLMRDAVGTWPGRSRWSSQRAVDACRPLLFLVIIIGFMGQSFKKSMVNKLYSE